MAAQFDTLVAAEALHDAGIDGKHAKAIATQLRLASDAGEPVTRPELQAALAPLATRTEFEAGLGALKTELIDRMAETEKRMLQHGAETEKRMLQHSAETEKRTLQNSAEMERRLMDRTTALIWQLFGAMVAIAGPAVAVVKLTP